MSVHDWTSHWFHQPEADEQPQSEAADLAPKDSAPADALVCRDAEVTVLAARGARGTGSRVEAFRKAELEPGPDPDLAEDLAALSRVLLGVAVEPAAPAEVSELELQRPLGTRIRPGAVVDEVPPVPLTTVDDESDRPRGTRIRPGAVVDEVLPVALPTVDDESDRPRGTRIRPGAVVDGEPLVAVAGGARARRDVAPVIEDVVDTVAEAPRGKRAAAWVEEPTDLEVAEVPESDPESEAPTVELWPAPEYPAPVSDFLAWDAPPLGFEPAPVAETASTSEPEPVTDLADSSAPPLAFELEAAPDLDLDPLRWAEAAELGVQLDEPSGATTWEVPTEASWDAPTEASWDAPTVEVSLDFVQTDPEPERAPEPEPEPAPVVSWDILAVAPSVPAPRPAQNAAALLRELSFLD